MCVYERTQRHMHYVADSRGSADYQHSNRKSRRTDDSRQNWYIVSVNQFKRRYDKIQDVNEEPYIYQNSTLKEIQRFQVTVLLTTSSYAS